MKRPLALFLDIDGTILRSDHSLSDRVIDAVARLRDEGTLVCLATGRSWEALKPLYDRLSLKGPTVCYNSAIIVEGPEGRKVFEKDMDEAVARMSIAESRSRGLEFVGYRNSKLVYEKRGPNIEAYENRVGVFGSSVDFDTFDKLGFTKGLFFAEPPELKDVQNALENRFSDEQLSATYSGPQLLELMGGGVDKGMGLREVCRIHGVDVSDSAAMGDGWNDLALLQAAGDAWVMAGAPEELKALFPADRMAPHCDEDGAAQVMEAMLRAQEEG